MVAVVAATAPVAQALTAIASALVGGGLYGLIRSKMENRVSAGDVAEKALKLTNEALDTVQRLQTQIAERDQRIAQLEGRAASCQCPRPPM